jgi:hypothetical protein
LTAISNLPIIIAVAKITILMETNPQSQLEVYPDSTDPNRSISASSFINDAPHSQFNRANDVDVAAVTVGQAEEVTNGNVSLVKEESNSTLGLEYFLLVLMIAVLGIGLGAVLNAIINIADAKQAVKQVPFFNPFGEAALLIGLPMFVALFLRLTAKEEKLPRFLYSIGRRRSIQLILLLSFSSIVVILIEFFGILFGGNSTLASRIGIVKSESAWINLLHLIVDLGIAGFIFGYYWLKLNRNTGPK